MPSSTVFRRAKTADWSKGLSQCLQQAFGCDIDPSHAHLLLYRRAQRGIQTWVAVVDGQVVATASLFIEDKLIHDGRPVGHVEDVACVGDHKRKGIASELIRRLITEAKSEDCYKIILDCERGLTGFYQKFGFQENGCCMRLNT